MFGFKRRRRQRLRNQPFPSEWTDTILHNVPYYGLLSLEDQKELRGHTLVFLHEKRFEGCGGLEITDEIRVTIAAQACILILHRDTDYFPLVRTILVYPGEYSAPSSEELHDGIIHEEIEDRFGESWYRGPVVLAWDDVLRGATDIKDGYNVVFHEFAHQLDSESGDLDGAPVLPHPSLYKDWALVMKAEYKSLLDALENNRPHLIEEYASEEPAEFFAVVTELFFEKPTELKYHHPELYKQLSAYYLQDPSRRMP